MSNREIARRLAAQREREQATSGDRQVSRRMNAADISQRQVEEARRIRREQWERSVAERQAASRSAGGDSRTASTSLSIPFASLRQPTIPSAPAANRPTRPQPAATIVESENEATSSSKSPPPQPSRLLRRLATNANPAPDTDFPIVAHSAWNDARTMLHGFSYLYNTIDSLGVQMDRGLWLKIYAETPFRDRHLNWASLDDARRMQFIARNQGVQHEQSDEDEDVDDKRKFQSDDFFEDTTILISKASGVKRRYRQSSLPCYARNNGFFDPPATTYDSTLRRSFVVQNDGFLCSLHSFNNVMNRIAFAPPDTLGVIDMLRPLGNCYAQLEEVILAALREGIFLLQVRLTEASDLIPLHDTSEFPRMKMCLTLLKRAGGMLVYRPSAAGHFVSLVYSDDSRLVPGTPRWAIFDSRIVVARGQTAATTLENFIFRSNIIGISNQKSILREQAKRAANQRSDYDSQYIGLLPISLETLLELQQQQQQPEEESDVGDDYITRDLELRVVRSLLRRSLSETRVIKTGLNAVQAANQQTFEINVPAPLRASSLDSLTRDVDRNNLTGLEQTNPASLFAFRYAIDLSLNDNFETISRAILQYYTNTRTKFWRRQLTDAIKNVRGTLASDGIGLFFLSARKREDELRQFIHMHSNRRWFRYFVLLIVCDTLDNYIGTKPEIPKPANVPESKNPRNNPDNDQWYLPEIPTEIMKLIVLLCLVGFTDFSSVGSPHERTPKTIELFEFLYPRRDDLLPRMYIPGYIAEIVHGPSSDANHILFNKYFIFNRYEKTLWLLEFAAKIRLPNREQTLGLPMFPLPSIEPFRLKESSKIRVAQERRGTTDFDPDEFLATNYDNSSYQYDEAADFVFLLRSTLFRLPLADQDSVTFANILESVSFNQNTSLVLAEHMHNVAEDFVALAVTAIDEENDSTPFQDINDTDDAKRWIDIVAFDRMFAGSLWQQQATNRHTHLVSVSKPRIFERTLQIGFNEIHRRVFGYRTSVVDDRPVITNNPTRIASTDAEGRPFQRWDDVRPLIGARQQLEIRRIGESSAGILLGTRR